MTEPCLPEESLFLQAIEINSCEEQAAFLDQACGSNADLRRSVEDLLRHHREGSGFLESPPTEVVAAAEQLTAREPEAPAFDFLSPSTEDGSIGRLGQYEILELLGCGGFGIVLKARDSKLDRIVAIKTLTQSLASSATARQRFVREAKAAAAVRHENVVGIYHVSDEGPVPYLVMECVSGLSLEEKLQQSGMLDLPAILRIGLQVASGLAAAHRQGLVHRDVKPGNILLENGVERVKITDFGLARAANEAAITRTGEVAGTPQYMSPEQALGQPVDHRSDLFSLGSVLYAMCTGRSPFRAETVVAALRRVCDDTPRPIREINPDIPQWLVEIVDRLLAKQPADRFQTADELAVLLGRHLAELQHPAPALQASSRPTKQAVSKAAAQRKHWAVALVVLLCLGVGLGLAEATGTTHFAATVIRILTPDGTLVVETDDPGVKVTIEGDGGLVITGAGPQEVRLRPGNYTVRADKDGQKAQPDRELISITHGDRQRVRVLLEGMSPKAKPTTATTEPQPFVILDGQGRELRKFESLAGAIQAASSGDTIEIRGNGPFISEPIDIKTRSLVIRAGEGFCPAIKMSETKEGQADLLTTDAPLVLEGLEIEHASRGERGFAYAVIGVKGGALYVTNCRLKSSPLGANVAARGGSTSKICEFRNCELVTGTGPSAVWNFHDGQIVIDNCVLAAGGAFACAHRPDQRKLSVRLSRNTLLASTILSFTVADAKNILEPNTDFVPIRFELSENVIAGLDSIWLLGKINEPHSPEEKVAMLSRLPLLFAWREQGNLYSNGHRFIAPHAKKLAEWNDFWGQTETGCQQAAVKFQGGDLFAKRTAGATLVREDFRLRPDSAGYRAGKDGKDLGADVDLVGPGPAYERWKKTPEYEQWLKDTGQLEKRAAARAEAGAFVLQAGGLAERKFDTLADAVQNASDGDTIEVRGDGPFTSDPINILGHALTVRAGDGFRPVIKLKAQSWEDISGNWTACIKTNASLVLEGLELRPFDPPPKLENLRFFVSSFNAPLHVANCRFLTPHESCIYVYRSPLCVVRNCELLNIDAAAVCGRRSPGAQWIIDNCLQAALSSLRYSSEDTNPQGGSIRLTRSSAATTHGVWHDLAKVSALPAAGQNFKPIRLEVSDNILAADNVLLFNQTDPVVTKSRLLEAAEAEAVLVGLLDWQGRGNLYGDNLLHWCVGAKPIPPHGPKSFDDWKHFWNSSETGSLQSRVRFQGGDLRSRMATALEKLTPDDFRLREDSPGYRAGPGGKDLGADVDLVGPGKAYERWKETPEYQQWLKDTGQLRAEAPKPESKPFALLGGKGVAERKFDTLVAAVLAASDGDTIEIRGNGPFISEPINIQRTALSIRAGAGFWPVIKLSPEAIQRDVPLIGSNAALVLEGLELHRGAPEDPAYGRYAMIKTYQAPLRTANCRFSAAIFPIHSPVCVFRNCEFLAASGVGGRYRPGARVVLENCLRHRTGIAMSINYDGALHDISIEIRRCTIVSTYTPLWLGLSSPLPVAVDGSQPISLIVSDSIFDVPLVLGFDQRPDFLAKAAVLPPTEAEATFLRLLRWRGERNLFSSGSASVMWAADGKLLPPRPPTSLEEWKLFWGAAESNSLEGSVRFQGGNLVSRGESTLDQLMPDDFRLRPDSAGYRAGPDGKDLGADVDLVGPGPAYERWKRTPEYQTWLKETGQRKETAGNRPEAGAFVLLGGAVVAERKFDTLADAVQRASDGDTIEIRGNGPFVSPPVTIGNQALTIRAGAAFRPVIRLSSEGGQRGQCLLTTSAALVLEGLDLQHRAPSDAGNMVLMTRAPLWAANCRFRNGVLTDSRVCAFRNCETSFVWGSPRPGARWIFENCLLRAKEIALMPHYSDASLHDVSIQIKRSTVVSPMAVNLCLDVPLPDRPDARQAAQSIRFDVSGSVFGGSNVLGFDLPQQLFGKGAAPQPAEAEATLLRLLKWQGERNIFATGSTSVLAAQLGQHLPGPKGLEAWKRFWGGAEVDSLEGRLRFQGGNLSARMDTDLDQLTPDDFRLRADSPGYRAGKDGKDLGADVDLVGPGAAYERWKKTPEYQQWLKDMGQLKDLAAAKRESGAFALLGGAGVAERKFDTLAEAVQRASDGDTIEILGNGPFVTKPVLINQRSLIIRAGAGFRPLVALDSEEPKDYLIRSNAPLVLEGLDLQWVNAATPTPESRGSDLVISSGPKAQLHAANCRFLMNRRDGVNHTLMCVDAWDALASRLRNCQCVVAGHGNVSGTALQTNGAPNSEIAVDNCLIYGNGVKLQFTDAKPRKALLSRSTILPTSPVLIRNKIDLSLEEGSSPPIELAMSASVLASPVVWFHQPRDFLEKPQALSATEAQQFLKSGIAWRGSRNLFLTSDKELVGLAVDGKYSPSTLPVKTLDDWKHFWGLEGLDAEIGQPKFQGGDLVAKAASAPELVTPDDFRLRPDSAGYRAGKDGKDLGADVDLVGPGPAYERWKKTAEYQQWLSEIHQISNP